MSEFTSHRCFVLAVVAACLGLARSSAAVRPGAIIRYGNLPVGTHYAIVYFDHRVKGPPDYNAHNTIVPQYNPKIPYDPNNFSTSPLLPPAIKGGHAYLGQRYYDGVDFLALYGPIPAPKSPADTIGYGRAFNLPYRYPPTAGNAPAVLMDTATEARPPDVAAITAGQNHLPAQPPTADDPSAILAAAVLGPTLAAVATTAGPTAASGHEKIAEVVTPHAVAQTQPVSISEPQRQLLTRLALAFTAEDEHHARADLPRPVPPK